jgi:uncharacterized protein (DUF362 family)
MPDNKVSRRSFLKQSTALAGTASLLEAIPFSKSLADATAPDTAVVYKYPNAGKIVIVENPKAVLGYNNVDQTAVQGMIDQGIMQFTGVTSSPADAFASLFPGLTTSKKIALKPNFLNSIVPTRKEVTKAVITRLLQMLGGFPAQNITVYERHTFSSVGYTSAFFGVPVNLVFDDSFPNLGYTILCNGKNRPYSKSLHDADYLINMPVLKDHSCSTALNVTLAFKNHMGSLNPGGSLGIHCDKKAVVDVMADSVMTTKQRLVILDALYAVYNGGPSGSPQATPCQIMFSQDPVTTDYQGRKLINTLRAANGLSAKAATYIEEAAATPYTIGIADPSLMNVIRVSMPVRLSLFVATLSRTTVQLHWVTEAEENNAAFAIERRFTSSEEWKEIGSLPGNGTSSRKHEYRFADTLSAENLAAEEGAYYRLRQIDFDGHFQYSVSAIVLLKGPEESFVLEQNYPNPFSGSTEIRVSLPVDGELSLKVYDAKGVAVATVVQGVYHAGDHTFPWKADGIPAGVYYGRAVFGQSLREIQIIITK